MGGGDHARLPVREQHRRAIGGEDAEREAGAVGDDRVGLGAGVVGPGRGRVDGVGRMDLVDGDEPGAGRDRLDRAAAILGDGVAVVVRAEADIEAGADALRHAAAPAEKAVRDVAQHRRADDFDAHSFSRMMMSSSAWLPTMKI